MDTPQTKSFKFGKNIKNAIVINGKSYAYTQTFSNRIVSGLDLRKQYEMTMNIIYKHFKNIGDYVIYPEMHASGNIHWHGTMAIHDRIKYYKTLGTFQGEIGFVTMVEIDDQQGWDDYCNKDINLMREILGEQCPIPINNEISKTYKEYLKYLKKHASTNNIIKQCNEGTRSKSFQQWYDSRN